MAHGGTALNHAHPLRRLPDRLAYRQPRAREKRLARARDAAARAQRRDRGRARGRDARVVDGRERPQDACDAWHCHDSRAACAGYLALPRFPCNFRGICGTAKHLAQSGEHACGAPRGIALHSRDGTRVRSSIRDDFERRRRSDCGIACYTEFERCPAHSGSLVLVLAPLSLRQYSGAIYFQKRAVRLTPSSPGRARWFR